MSGQVLKRPHLQSAALQLTGSYHASQGQPCEDVVYMEETDGCAFYGLADGQSGKRYCAAGARSCLRQTAAFIREQGIGNLREYPYTDEMQARLVRRLRNCLEVMAMEHDVASQEFASTVIAMAVDQNGDYVLTHLGDGVILGVTLDETIRVLSRPENPMPNCTWLTSSRDAISHLHFSFGSVEGYRRIFLLTDGAEALCSGTRIPNRARELLVSGSEDELRTFLAYTKPKDDASVLMVEVGKKL